MHRSSRQAGYPSDSSRAAGSRLGCGQRVEACCFETTSSIGLATSATAPGRSKAGRCRRSRTIPCWPERRFAGDPLAKVPYRRSVWARCPSVTAPGRRCGPGAVPRPRLLITRVRKPASAIALGRRCSLSPGRCRTGHSPCMGPVGHLIVPHVADLRTAARATRGADRLTASPPRASGHRPIQPQDPEQPTQTTVGELTLPQRAESTGRNGFDARGSSWVSLRMRSMPRGPGHGPFKLGRSTDRSKPIRGVAGPRPLLRAPRP
jgi:hypothetical protein